MAPSAKSESKSTADIPAVKTLPAHPEGKNNLGEKLRDVILGGQDGLINILGLTLAVAGAVNDAHVVIIAGLAALAAESISIGAVAYTSQRAEYDFFESELDGVKKSIASDPERAREKVRVLYERKGFRGAELLRAVDILTAAPEVWMHVLMAEERKLHKREWSPLQSGLLVGSAAVIGSIIPLIPFFFLPVSAAMWAAVIASVLILFVAGAVKARLTVGNWVRSGLEMAAVGTAAALLGYLIGRALAVAPIP